MDPHHTGILGTCWNDCFQCLKPQESEVPSDTQTLDAYMFKPHGPLGFSLLMDSQTTSFSALLSSLPLCIVGKMVMEPLYK